MVFNPGDIKIMDNLREVRSIVRSVLRESVIKETTVASFDAYHGTDHLINKFEDSFLAGESNSVSWCWNILYNKS